MKSVLIIGIVLLSAQGICSGQQTKTVAEQKQQFFERIEKLSHPLGPLGPFADIGDWKLIAKHKFTFGEKAKEVFLYHANTLTPQIGVSLHAIANTGEYHWQITTIDSMRRFHFARILKQEKEFIDIELATFQEFDIDPATGKQTVVRPSVFIQKRIKVTNGKLSLIEVK